MNNPINPKDRKDLLDALSWAAGKQIPLEIACNGSKRTFGRPIQSAVSLNTNSFKGITEYEPSELVLTSGVATPISEVEAVLDSSNQMLSFEPIDLGPLLRMPSSQGTLIGALSCNLSGPRRIKAGAARDHFLGFEGVSGRGEFFKAGGKVVKNVTGYDLCKLLCGSFGTLGVLTSVSLKVLPAPEKIRTLVIYGLDEMQAIEAFSKALSSPNEPSGATWIPSYLSSKSKIDRINEAGESVTAIRIEGVKVSVEARLDDLEVRLKSFGEMDQLHSNNSKYFWKEVRDVRPLAHYRNDESIWRLSVPPYSGGNIAKFIKNEMGAETIIDWGGALIWAKVNMDIKNSVTISEKIHKAAKDEGGHATCISASVENRGIIEVFPILSSAEYGLMKRIKEGFDPMGILNPGRMYLGL